MKPERTSTPGVYKRGNRFLFSYRVGGRQKWESASTEKLAKKAKEARATHIARGEFSERSRVTLHEYASEWVERYQGVGGEASASTLAPNTARSSTATCSRTSRRGCV